jgi:hypothetical protein
MKVFCIGPDGTEYYAANSAEEMRTAYIELVGAEQAEQDFKGGFKEIAEEEMDSEFFHGEEDEDGGYTQELTTWRKLAEDALPGTQISTGY